MSDEGARRPVPRVARRLEGIALSPIRAMNAGAPEGSVQLGLGEPTWDLPRAGRRALASGATRDGPCSYGPNSGLPELVTAIASFYSTPAERVMLAAGSQGALFSIFMSRLGPGDEVLVPDPGFVSYPILAALAGATARPYRLSADGSLDAPAFAEALAACPGAAAAVINHPANPTGGGASVEALTAVAAACEERGVLLVSDEVYRELYFGARPPSLADVTDKGLVLSSVSKAWGAAGLRVGWALGDPELLAGARLVHNYMISCVARPSQEAALALIEDSASILPAARAELKARWDALAGALKAELGSIALPPAGAFYYWMTLPPGFASMAGGEREVGRGGDATAAFCLRLRDEGGVIVVPGSAFGERGIGRARLSFAARPEALREGVRRLAPFWRKA